MTKLNPAVAAELAELINSYECAQIMRKTMADQKNWVRVDYYRTKEAELVCQLADEYGIELPSLEGAREIVRLDDDQTEIEYLTRVA